MPAEAPLKNALLKQPVSPKGVSLEASPTGASLLQQQGHSRLDVTPAVTRAGASAARVLLGITSATLELCLPTLKLISEFRA